MTEEKRNILSVEIPQTILNALDRIINLDTHANKSEFVREALRLHIERHAKKLGLTFSEVLAAKEEKK